MIGLQNLIALLRLIVDKSMHLKFLYIKLKVFNVNSELSHKELMDILTVLNFGKISILLNIYNICIFPLIADLQNIFDSISLRLSSIFSIKEKINESIS